MLFLTFFSYTVSFMSFSRTLTRDILLLILLLSTLTDFTVKFTLNFPSKKHSNFFLYKRISLHFIPHLPHKKREISILSWPSLKDWDYLINLAFNIRFTIIICITLNSCIDFNTHRLVFPHSFILNIDSFWECIDYIQVLFSYIVFFSKWAVQWTSQNPFLLPSHLG